MLDDNPDTSLLVETNPDTGIICLGGLVLFACLFIVLGLLPDDTLKAAFSGEDRRPGYRLDDFLSDFPIIYRRVFLLGLGGYFGFLIWKLHNAYGKKRALLKLMQDGIHDLRSEEFISWRDVRLLSFDYGQFRIFLKDRKAKVAPIASLYVSPRKNEIIAYLRQHHPELLG